ncbi:conjugal transfer protein [Vibrio alginolyticus]|nr:conjugal transfer protein [Vibrio alginolyticus]
MTKKRLRFVLSLGIIFPTLTLSPIAYAASDADCSIWLCLPTGFPSGCGEAKNAFTDRIKHFKSPLPNFSSCLLTGSPQGSTMTYQENVAAKMPDGHYLDGRRCQHYWDAPNDKWHWSPHGCTGTWYYINTYLDGQGYGEKFYYQR